MVPSPSKQIVSGRTAGRRVHAVGPRTVLRRFVKEAGPAAVKMRRRVSIPDLISKASRGLGFYCTSTVFARQPYQESRDVTHTDLAMTARPDRAESLATRQRVHIEVIRSDPALVSAVGLVQHLGSPRQNGFGPGDSSASCTSTQALSTAQAVDSDSTTWWKRH